MSDKHDEFDELRELFTEAATAARKAWALATVRNTVAKQENELYREVVSYSSSAVDVLTRAVKKIWEETNLPAKKKK